VFSSLCPTTDSPARLAPDEALERVPNVPDYPRPQAL
jgi:hypothetical protein